MTSPFTSVSPPPGQSSKSGPGMYSPTHVATTPTSFYAVFGLAQVLGILAIILVNVWITQHLGGYNWSVPGLRFNYHPLFMLLGFIFLSGNGILVYRLLRKEPKPMLKKLHAIINGLGLLFAIVGSVAVFTFHNDMTPPIPNLYSLHSWIGLLVIVLFALQFVAGTVAFLYPTPPGSLRSVILPFHIYGGTAIFALSIVAAISGINEKAIFALKSPPYSALPPAAIVLNTLGLTIVLFALTIGYLVTRPEYKRQPLPEEQQIQMSTEFNETSN